MELDHLETFRAVAHCGSFTAAAEQRHYAQSTVSVHIRALEGRVGAPLFDRLSLGVRLTEAGERLMPLAEQMLGLAAELDGVAGQAAGAVGEITVAAPESVVAHHLPRVLRHLREQEPGLTVRLEPIAYQEIRPAVSSGQLDVGFLFQPPLQPTSTLQVEALRSEELAMVVAGDHPLAQERTETAEEFSRTTLFLTERGCGYRSLLESHLDRTGVRPGHTLEFDSVEAIRRCVEAGLGVALLPRVWVRDELASGSLVTMDWFAPRFEVSVQASWHPARWHGPALQAVLDAARTCIADSSPSQAVDVGDERPSSDGAAAVGE